MESTHQYSLRKRKATIPIPTSSRKRSRLSIQNLPNEILMQIFDELPEIDVVCTIPRVCARWKDIVGDKKLSRTTIDASDDISVQKLCTWIAHSPNLQYLVLRNRRDVDREMLGLFATIYRHGQRHVAINIIRDEMGDYRNSREDVLPKAWLDRNGVKPGVLEYFVLRSASWLSEDQFIF